MGYQIVYDVNVFIKYFKNTDIKRMGKEDSIIKAKYNSYRKISKELGEKYLRYEFKQYSSKFRRFENRTVKLILSRFNFDIYVDVDQVPETFFDDINLHILKKTIDKFYSYVKDILPLRKVNIVLMDNNKSKVRAFEYGLASGYARLGTIYVSYLEYDKHLLYVHEYAHIVADSIPERVKHHLIDAFEQAVVLYFRKAKKKKVDISELNDKLISRICASFGLDPYAFKNEDEFFAEMIENWRSIPVNKHTYKLKKIVKDSIIHKL